MVLLSGDVQESWESLNGTVIPCIENNIIISFEKAALKRWQIILLIFFGMGEAVL